MPGRRWSLACLVALVMAFTTGVTALAQNYGEGLPPGVLAVSVEDQPINADATPQIGTTTPVFRGELEPGLNAAEFAVRPPEDLTWTVAIDAETGAFETVAPVAFAPGTHSLYIDDQLIGDFVVAEDAIPTILVDLAAMTLIPSDLEPGYRIIAGRLVSANEEATRLAGADGAVGDGEFDALLLTLEDAGWQRRYEVRLGNQSLTGGQLEAAIDCFVTEYLDAASAAAAFTQAADATGGEVEGAPLFGDQSEVTRADGVEGETPFRALTLTFQRDNYVAGINLLVYGDEEPSVDDLEALGAIFEERIAEIAGAEEIGLGVEVLRPALGADVTLSLHVDGYELRVGQALPFYGQTDSDFFARQARYDDATEVYYASYGGRVGATEGTGNFLYNAVLYRFADGDTATAWLASLPDRLLQDPLRGYLSMAVVADATTLGDGSATYAFSYQSGESRLRGYRIYARVGSEILQIEFGGLAEVPAADVEQLVAAQIACLQAGACPQPAPLPASVIPV